jgi:hypothetical protein
MKGHQLVIYSLRDLDAFCECGRWAILSTTRDDRSDAVIRKDLKEQHGKHLAYVRRTTSSRIRMRAMRGDS